MDIAQSVSGTPFHAQFHEQLDVVNSSAWGTDGLNIETSRDENYKVTFEADLSNPAANRGYSIESIGGTVRTVEAITAIGAEYYTNNSVVESDLNLTIVDVIEFEPDGPPIDPLGNEGGEEESESADMTLTYSEHNSGTVTEGSTVDSTVSTVVPSGYSLRQDNVSLTETDTWNITSDSTYDVEEDGTSQLTSSTTGTELVTFTHSTSGTSESEYETDLFHSTSSGSYSSNAYAQHSVEMQGTLTASFDADDAITSMGGSQVATTTGYGNATANSEGEWWHLDKVTGDEESGGHTYEAAENFSGTIVETTTGIETLEGKYDVETNTVIDNDVDGYYILTTWSETNLAAGGVDENGGMPGPPGGGPTVVVVTDSYDLNVDTYLDFYHEGYGTVGYKAFIATPSLPEIPISLDGVGDSGDSGDDGSQNMMGGGQGSGGEDPGGEGDQEGDEWAWNSDPGLGESLIPIWGSGRSAMHNFSKFASEDGTWGDFGWGVAYTALAITDVFLVKSLVVGVGKLAAKGFSKAGLSGMFKQGWKGLFSPGAAKYYSTEYHLFTNNAMHYMWKSAGRFYHGMNGVVKPIGKGRLGEYIDFAGKPILWNKAFPVFSTALQNRRGKWFINCGWTAAARYIEGNAVPILAATSAARAWFSAERHADDDDAPIDVEPPKVAPEVEKKVPADMAPQVGGLESAGQNNNDETAGAARRWFQCRWRGWRWRRRTVKTRPWTDLGKGRQRDVQGDYPRCNREYCWLGLFCQRLGRKLDSRAADPTFAQRYSACGRGSL